MKAIRSALISLYDKASITPLLETLNHLNIDLISTGGTYKVIEESGYTATKIEDLTDYPSILGGRVKTLHPQVFGGILARGKQDQETIEAYDIPQIDLVIVDCYPFEESLRNGDDVDTLIEHIDIGGISLIRAAAKNYKEVAVIPSANYLPELKQTLHQQEGYISLEQRKAWAAAAFTFTANYDTAIQQSLKSEAVAPISLGPGEKLRYGENPHQASSFHGNIQAYFEQLNGKQLSHNNLVDIDAAIRLIEDLPANTFAIIKHTNPCGVATRHTLHEAWEAAYAGDPVSAFGGILATNAPVDEATADAIGNLFFEVLIAPDFQPTAFEKLKQKSNRILLKQKQPLKAKEEVRSVLDGVLKQDRDNLLEKHEDLQLVTTRKPENEASYRELIFANTIVKHAKSNAIVLSKNEQLVGIGVGQTSRVDALKQAIEKGRYFDLPVSGSSMASDAFFPFSDSVAIANEAGIQQVIQPGGSKRDQDSIEYCNQHDMVMVTTGNRHFKH